MKTRSWRVIIETGFAMLAGVSVLFASAQPDSRSFSEQGAPKVADVKSPADLLKSIPVIGRIPQSFFFGGSYRMKFDGKELQIDHMGPTSHATAASQRNCMISLTWTSPVAFFGSEINLPILQAETYQRSDWRLNSFGDYEVHLSKDAPNVPWVGLKTTIHF